MRDKSVDARSATVQGYFEKPLLVGAVLTIPATIIEFSSATKSLHTAGAALNWVIWLAFLSELVLMLVVVPQRGRYLLEHPIDFAIVLLTPPFLQSAVQGARLLRLLRLLRFLRLDPLARILFSLEGIRAIGALALLTAIAGGAGFATEEHLSFGNGLYWAISTMTTVGGNLEPKTAEAKIIAVIVMFVGIGTATVFIGAVAQRFLLPSTEQAEDTEDDVLAEMREIAARLGRLEQRLQSERQAAN